MTFINVFKFGGSLLTSGSYHNNVKTLLHDYQHDVNILICGGGPSVQQIRTSQRQFNLSDAECHHNSLVVMDRNTRHLCQHLKISVVDTWRQLISQVKQTPVTPQWLGFAVTQFVLDEDPQLPRPQLPGDWNTTSDSIAARVASLLNARLILAKSTSPTSNNLLCLANQGYVDNHFPVAAASINSVTFVDLSH